jgi:L-alanine-DL-glutamate epimerase-like enolase superfamily enzyme
MICNNKRETQRMLSRRSWFRLAAASSVIGPLFKFSEAPAVAQTQGGGVNKNSAPSNLKITDIRACLVASNFNYPIIRIDTNQGVYGLGECFAGSTMGSALVLKPYLVGRNPLEIESILGHYGTSYGARRGIRNFAGQNFWNTGYGAVDVALHDIAGKVYGVPVWRILGNKLRDRIRIYCDTTGSRDPKVFGQRMLARKKQGYTWFKMDLGSRMVADRPGAVNPVTGLCTDKGLPYLCEYIAAVKDAIGWEQPLAADHFGLMDVTDAIRYAKAFEPYTMAWAEDLLENPLDWRGYKTIHDASTTRLLTGELAFGLEEGFQGLIDNQAVDYLHPDIIASGGLLEIKRIADYADSKGMQVAIHQPGSPIGQIAAVHLAATMPNFLVCEHHAVDIPWWDDLVTGLPKPMIDKGYVPVPDAPGLGLELNDTVVKEHLRRGGYFEPSTMYGEYIVGPIVEGGPYPHLDENGRLVNTR